MIKSLILAFLLIPSLVHSWTLIHPKNAQECIEKNLNKVKYIDAAPLLGAACHIGYEKGEFKKDWIAAGRCIVEDSSRLYTYEEAVKVINSCSESREVFGIYMGALNQRQRAREAEQVEARERRERERRQAEIRREDERNSLRDAPRMPITCIRVEYIVDCW